MEQNHAAESLRSRISWEDDYFAKTGWQGLKLKFNS